MAIRGKAVQFSRTGNPPDVVELVELEEPDPAAGEILCRIEAAPIAPSIFSPSRVPMATRRTCPPCPVTMRSRPWSRLGRT